MVSAGEAAYRSCRLRARRVVAAELAGMGRWLFIAPHPDDEALGCGGLLHLLAEAGQRPLVAYLTDGAGSHRGSPTWPPARLASTRRQEALTSLRALGVPPCDVMWLSWPDAQPHLVTGPEYGITRDRLARLCRAAHIRAIATTWSGEPHCDHVAAFELAKAVSGRGIALFQYLVWGWTSADLQQQLAGRRLMSIDVRASGTRRKRALACHRTQMTGTIADAAEAFRLPPSMARLAERPTEILIAPLRPRDAV